MNTANAYIYPILSEIRNSFLIRKINLINFCFGIFFLFSLSIACYYDFFKIQNYNFFFRAILILGLAQLVFISLSSKPTFFILHSMSKIVLKYQLVSFFIALSFSCFFLILGKPFDGILVFMFTSISFPHLIISFLKYES